MAGTRGSSLDGEMSCRFWITPKAGMSCFRFDVWYFDGAFSSQGLLIFSPAQLFNSCCQLAWVPIFGGRSLEFHGGNQENFPQRHQEKRHKDTTNHRKDRKTKTPRKLQNCLQRKV